MTTRLAVLLEGTPVTAEGVTYTSDGCVTSIDKITATNEAAALATVTVQLISPDGGLIQSFSKSVQPGLAWPFPEIVGHTLDIGGRIKVTCPTPTTIKIRISGRQFT